MRRVLICLGVGLALIPVGVLALHLYLNSDAVRAEVLRRVRERLPASAVHFEIGDSYAVDWFGRVSLGPVSIAAAPGARPWISIGEVRVRPRYGALLRGRAEPARIRLRNVRFDVDLDQDEVRRALEALRGRPPGSTGSGAVAGPGTLALVIEGLDVGRTGPTGWETLLGPVDGTLLVSRDAGGRALEGHAVLPGGARVQLGVSLPRGAPFTLNLQAEAVQASALPEPLTARLPVRIGGGTLDGHVRIESVPSLETGKLEGSIAAHDLSLDGERLAPEPVGPIELGVDLSLGWERGKRKLLLDRARLSAGRERVALLELTGELQLAGGWPFRIDATAGPVPYPKLLGVLPPQLVPPPEIPRPDGLLGATARLQGELRKPTDWKVEVRLDLAGLRKAAKATPLFLAGPFVYRPRVSAGTPREIQVGEANPDFVPLAELPVHVYRAVTYSEDGGFFGHQGFDFLEMKDSLVEALEQKRFRGASTITQQLVKNLFLTRDRVWARKVKEALITVLLEASLPKQRLLEIYLNIIEWGPDLYGLGAAARYYFGVDPRELSVKQAAYLATIIPSPVKTHVFFTKGAINEVWEKRVHDLLVRLWNEDVITLDQFEAAEATPVVFRAKDAPVVVDEEPQEDQDAEGEEEIVEGDSDFR